MPCSTDDTTYRRSKSDFRRNLPFRTYQKSHTKQAFSRAAHLVEEQQSSLAQLDSSLVLDAKAGIAAMRSSQPTMVDVSPGNLALREMSDRRNLSVVAASKEIPRVRGK